MTLSVAGRPTRPAGSKLRVLWTLVRPHWRTLLLGTFLGLGATGAALATPMATKAVLDSLGADASLAKPVGLLLGLVVLGAVSGFAQWLLLGRLAERIVVTARRSLVRRFFRGPVGDVQRHSPGELVSRVTSDTVLLREAASSSLVDLVNGAVSLVGAIVLMAVLDVPLLLSTVVAVVLIGIVMVVLMPRIGAAQHRAQQAVGQLGGLLEGGVRAIRTVKASRAEERESHRVLAQADEAARHGVRAAMIEAGAWSVAGGGIQLAVIAILGIGAWRVSEGTMAVSTLIAFLLYAFQLVDPVTELTATFSTLQSGIAAAARIQELEAMRTEDLTRGSTFGPTKVGAATVRFQDVSFRYPGSQRAALDGVTLELPGRGHTAIVGPSGAGKTTVLSLLLRFAEPGSGTITMQGTPYRDLSIDAVRSRITYVEQETPLLPGTVRENVTYRYPGADDEEVWAALRAVHLEDKVRTLPLQLDQPVSGTDLSGGERQRIALARAVVRQPELLLLDEATAQLDGLTESAVQAVIREVARHGSVVTIAHRLSTVVEADQIYLMESGRVRATGTHQDLLTSDPLYRELVEALTIPGQETLPQVSWRRRVKSTFL